MQFIFSFPLDLLGPFFFFFFFFENGVLLMYMNEGVSSIANIFTAYEESQ